MAEDDDRTTRDDVLAVVRAVALRAKDVAGSGAGALGTGVDEAVSALIDRRVERALRGSGRAVTSDDVVAALSSGGSSSIAPWIGGAGARLARHSRVARHVGGRTPIGLALLVGPMLLETVTSSVRGLDATAAHLVAKARDKRIEPDPERVRTVVVQALTGERIDPDADVDHGALVRLWLADAGRRVAPLGLGRIRGLTRGRTPEAVAASLAEIDVRRLRAR
jgi:hypothetical protein